MKVRVREFDPDRERERRYHSPPAEEIGDTFSEAEEPSPVVEEFGPEAAGATLHAVPSWDSEHAYPGGPMVGPNLPRPLYPPDAKGYAPSKDGKDVVAWKRGISRGGRWPWQKFDDSYSNAFSHGKSGNVSESGIAGFQRQMKIDPTGYLGKKTCNAIRSARIPEGLPHAGEPLLDQTAINLLEDYVAEAKGGSVDNVRAMISDYCARSIDAASDIHYLQQRAMTCLGIAPEAGFTADCSEHSTAAYWWARIRTGVAVPDPNGNAYNGYGYTGTLIANPEASHPWKVGDLAIYGRSFGDTSHVCTCYVAGSDSTSVWCSHGSEEAPYAVSLHYRSDLLVVVRPKLTP